VFQGFGDKSKLFLNKLVPWKDKVIRMKKASVVLGFTASTEWRRIFDF